MFRPREERKKDEKSRPKAEPVKESWSEDEAETKRVEEVADTQKTLEEEPEKVKTNCNFISHRNWKSLVLHLYHLFMIVCSAVVCP